MLELVNKPDCIYTSNDTSYFICLFAIIGEYWGKVPKFIDYGNGYSQVKFFAVKSQSLVNFYYMQSKSLKNNWMMRFSRERISSRRLCIHALNGEMSNRKTFPWLWYPPPTTISFTVVNAFLKQQRCGRLITLLYGVLNYLARPCTRGWERRRIPASLWRCLW